MIKIGEFSKMSNVSVRMLRHYDQLGILTPIHVDESSGYRFYKAEQLQITSKILHLRELGVSLDDIAKTVGNNCVTKLSDMLLEKSAQLECESRELKQRLNNIEHKLSNLTTGKNDEFNVTIKSVSAYNYASVRRTVTDLERFSEHCKSMHEFLYNLLASKNIEHCEREITRYHSYDVACEFLDVEVGVVIKKISDATVEGLELKVLPECAYVASVIHHGAFYELKDKVVKLLEWVEWMGWIPNGPLREIHHSGRAIVNGVEMTSPVLELQLPITNE